jgi:hypothetical protein
VDINQQKEQFSSNFVRVVAAVAGYALYKPEVDEDSVDWGIAAVMRNWLQGATSAPKSR